MSPACVVLLAGFVVVGGTGPAAAQEWEVAVHGVAATNGEIERVRQARGLGLGAEVSARFGRWSVRARGYSASLRADFTVQPDYAVEAIDLWGTYAWRAHLSLQAGVGRRFVRPDFVAQEIGIVRLGVLSETQVARLARLWARGALLPLVRFSGGGSAGLGLELGFGTRVGEPDSRWFFTAEYEYQRLNRTVGGGAAAGRIAAPIQTSAARVGAGYRIR